MSGKYQGTQTEKNLQAAFAGESQARNKYTYFASAAKKEGYEQIAAMFLKTADNEKEHAKMWLNFAASSGNPSSWAVLANPSYISVHSKFSPSAAAPAQTASKGKTVWRCKVCGYTYEGEELPADFVCPVCKHPAWAASLYPSNLSTVRPD